MKSPFFSIITCTKNSEKYLPQCLRSIFCQTYKNFEVVIVDGYSTDRTLSIVKKFQKKYPKKIRIILAEPKGIANAMNIGILNARGKVINHLHSDDCYSSNRTLETVKKAFDKDNKKLWLIGNLSYIDENNNIKTTTSVEYSYGALLQVDIVPHPSTFLKKRVFEKFGLFDEQYKLAMDYEYWLRIGKELEPIVLKQILAFFRDHKGSSTRQNICLSLKESFRILGKYNKGLFRKVRLYKLYWVRLAELRPNLFLSCCFYLMQTFRFVKSSLRRYLLNRVNETKI